ncbi:MAG: hypothetical protein DI601_04045 [Azospirillum brasilense]|nr:MAG: hypothetical protein DI601_04045 [Azospirillum brasilense]
MAAAPSGANATLSRALGQSVLAALMVLCGRRRRGAAGLALSRAVPARAGRKLGAGPYTALTLTAAVVTSVLLDHFGLVGFEVRSLSLPRVLGCALMIGGVVLIARY